MLYEPFSMRSIDGYGFGPYVFSLVGTFPISKGACIHKMEPYLEQAIREQDVKKPKCYVKTLPENGYEDKTVKAAVTRSRKAVHKEK